MCKAGLPVCLAFALLGCGGELRGAELTSEITMGARVTAVTPSQPVRIHWRWGGEGLGGEPVRGELTVADGDAADHLWLPVGAWSRRAPLSVFKARMRRLFVTFTLEGVQSKQRSSEALRNVAVQFEFQHAGKVLKRFTETGPDGPTVGIVVPLDKLGDGPQPAAEFVDGLQGVLRYAERRAEWLGSLPWAAAAVPKRYAFLTDCAGYRPGAGYAIRTTNREALLAEFRALRQLGVNGWRNAPDFALEMIRSGQGLGPQFARIRDAGGLGYPVPRTARGRSAPGAGCPYHPDMADFRRRVQDEAAKVMEQSVRKLPVEEYWLLTVDEIGSVFDLAPEGKDHQGACPHCGRAFHEYLKGLGLTLADFDAKSWDDVRSTYGYWSKTKADEEAQRPAAGKPAVDKAAVDQTDAQAARAAKARAKLPPPGAPSGPPPVQDGDRRAPMSERGWALLSYYSKRFNNDASAMLFAPQREFFERENEKKRLALAAGRSDAEARQPWVYSYALRGNTFLMAGHSLDFFDFYRQADNGFMYETSNRDPRVWQWDGYLCDVGRVLSDRLGKRFGVYVKPHRGAPIQRALTALSRQAKVVYWYTYGPDWVKGDSFSELPWALAAVSRAARLVAAAEEVTYEARPLPAEIAVVRPRTSEFFENSASWENGKWVHTALTHAHLPVDPLDEELLLSADLSRYKAIYVSGSHLRRNVAERLAQWVRSGGTLYTSGWGLARDEANQPLSSMLPVLGLRSRPEVELWNDVARYGASALAPLRPVRPVPGEAATVRGAGPLAGGFRLSIGREPLDPLPGAEVLARFGDGRPAVTRHVHGKGSAYVIGFYPGLEYSVAVLKEDYDLARDFDPARRAFVAAPALAAGARPVADASVPLVEGVLLRNARSGKSAVTLVNWAYRAGADAARLVQPSKGYALVPLDSLTVVVRGTGPVREVRSAWTGAKLQFRQRQEAVEVALPRLEEADVLLIE